MKSPDDAGPTTAGALDVARFFNNEARNSMNNQAAAGFAIASSIAFASAVLVKAAYQIAEAIVDRGVE